MTQLCVKRSYLYKCWVCGRRGEFETKEAAYEAGFWFPEKYIDREPMSMEFDDGGTLCLEAVVPKDYDKAKFHFVYAICSDCFDK